MSLSVTSKGSQYPICSLNCTAFNFLRSERITCATNRSKMKAVASANQRPNTELLFVERKKTHPKTNTSLDTFALVVWPLCDAFSGTSNSTLRQYWLMPGGYLLPLIQNEYTLMVEYWFNQYLTINHHQYQYQCQTDEDLVCGLNAEFCMMNQRRGCAVPTFH